MRTSEKLMLRQSWVEAKQGGLDKLMYEAKYSSACIEGNPPQGGGMTIMRDQCMDKKRFIRLEVFRGRKLLLESRNQEGCSNSTVRRLSGLVRIREREL